mgnify:CR=1 FL=1
MIPLIGLPRQMATETLATIALPRWSNVTDGLIGGYNESVQTPDWAPSILGILSVYVDFLGPLALVLMFSIPFFMMWLSHGNMKLIGFLGLMVGGFVFVYLPSNYMLAALIFIVISAAGLLWGLFKQ